MPINPGMDAAAAVTRMLDKAVLDAEKERIEKIRGLRRLKETKEELSKVSGIKNDAILQKLVELKVTPEVLVPIKALPLVEVAWADGTVDELEKKAVLKAANRMGFSEESAGYVLIIQWFEHRPTPDHLEVWMHYIKGLCEQMSKDQKKAFKEELVGSARAVAQASGGFLGLNKISKEEDDVLKKLEGAFD
jgi:tellurite resistance protein